MKRRRITVRRKHPAEVTPTPNQQDDSSRTGNNIAIAALVVSLLAAGFTGWQAYEAHKANQFQVHQADSTTAGNVLIARANDYPTGPLKGSSFAVQGPQVIVNLNHSAISGVMAQLYTGSGRHAGIEMIGDMPGCTEVNVTSILPRSDQSFMTTLIEYSIPDGNLWQRAYMGSPTETAASLVTGSRVTEYFVPNKHIIHVPGC